MTEKIRNQFNITYGDKNFEQTRKSVGKILSNLIQNLDLAVSKNKKYWLVIMVVSQEKVFTIIQKVGKQKKLQKCFHNLYFLEQ